MTFKELKKGEVYNVTIQNHSHGTLNGLRVKGVFTGVLIKVNKFAGETNPIYLASMHCSRIEAVK